MDDYLDQTRKQIQRSLFGILLVANLITLAGFWVFHKSVGLSTNESLLPSLALGTLFAIVISLGFSNYVSKPVRIIWQLIMDLSATQQTMTAPQIEKLKLGRQMVGALSAQLYQTLGQANQIRQNNQSQADDLRGNFIAQNLPLPMVVVDGSQNIKFANEAAARYIGIPSQDMVGKNVYMVLDMSFPNDDTLDNWLKEVIINSATATSSWERVRLNVRDSHPARLFDLAAYYNRDNAEGNETILVMFDHTKAYSQDEQAISFIALSVHELRTPLTLLRGYIEVFEDELGPTLSPEHRGFMQKMNSQAGQLTDYVNNILNVARVDDDQLELHLQSGDWTAILKRAVSAISLRAEVRGITLECSLATNLPPVGVDSISISEVVNNLIDNAIKYSGNSKVIKISTYLNQSGQVETSVQDFGNGMPASVLPNLFTKFYRDHRNRAQVGGTGLGLYLAKAIVTAHGGQIWVNSQEGQGSTFSFTLQPYSQLENDPDKDEQGVTRGAHGWIKNHSLYKR